MDLRVLLIALIVMMSLMLHACTPSAALSGTSWSLLEINGRPARADTTVTLNFEGDRVTGSDGCNTYSGPYSVRGDRFTVGKEIVSTLMACSEPIMKQAEAYQATLKQATAYQTDGQRLTLLGASGKVLATFARQSKELAGSSWTVTGYNNGKEALVSVLDGSTLTASFSADGKLSGSAGCNTYTTSYETSGATIKIAPAATTKKMCHSPAGVMEQEMQYLKALESTATYRLVGNQLELRTAAGASAVTLKRAP